MQCPRCEGATLAQRKLKGGDTLLDLCSQCKGIWFDEHELPQVLGTASKHIRVPPHAKRRDLACPRCSESLYTFCYPGTMVLVEMCKACKGIWLDDKEINRMHAAKDGARQARQRQASDEQAVREAAAPSPGGPPPAPGSSMRCPKCGQIGPKHTECQKCGVIVAKFRAAQERQRDRERRLVEEFPEGRGLKGSLLRFVNGSIERLTSF